VHEVRGVAKMRTRSAKKTAARLRAWRDAQHETRCRDVLRRARVSVYKRRQLRRGRAAPLRSDDARYFRLIFFTDYA
jgi:hypothetical protein